MQKHIIFCPTKIVYKTCMSVRVCHMYVFADIFACICIKTRQKKQKKLPNFCRVLCGNFSFIKLCRVLKKGINSPLFYRLNYARITDPILYLKSAQVKDFLNILYYKFWGQFSAACVWFCVFFSHIRTRKQKVKISTWFLWNITCCLLCIFCAWPCVKC